jgi:hypothetical protein
MRVMFTKCDGDDLKLLGLDQTSYLMWCYVMWRRFEVVKPTLRPNSWRNSEQQTLRVFLLDIIVSSYNGCDTTLCCVYVYVYWMGPGSLNIKKPVLVFSVKKRTSFLRGPADRHATKTLVLLRWSNRQRSQLGKSNTEGGTTPPLARKLPQRFADLFASLWGFFS